VTEVRAPRKLVRLNFTDGDVLVTSRDMDLFVISAERATAACREAARAGEQIERFQEKFLLPLHRWYAARADKVAGCYVPRPSGFIRVFIVTNSRRYDFELGKEVAALERELFHAGWRVGVMQLPATEDSPFGGFFDPEGALEVYAQRGPAPQEGGE
jgi:hypothetical protein